MNSWMAITISVFFGFVVAFFSGFVAIPWLHKKQSGQVIPVSHAFRKRNYTPTMGGILIAAGVAVSLSVVLVTDKLLGGDIVAEGIVDSDTEKAKLFSSILMAFSFGFIGFFDDYIKASGKRSFGLSIRQRALMEIIVITGYLWSLHMTGATYISVPFAGNADTGLFFWLAGPAIMYITMHSVRLSDSTDGLCSASTAVFVVSVAVIALAKGLFGAGLLCSAAAGVLAGFFIWNVYPSKVRLGSTGSMLLGGLIIAAAYCVNMPWIIALSGIGFMAEAVTYAMHIFRYKTSGGKKLLKRAPLNLHLEECGWKANRIVAAFSAMNITGSLIAILLVLAGRPE